MLRGNYADELARAGRYEEALAEYLWCFDEGERASPSYSGVRLSFLVSDIVRLGRDHPPAIQALEERRDAAEARLLDATPSRDDLRVAAALNRELNTPKRTLELYDRMRKAGPLPADLKFTLSHALLELLVEARRYQDAIDLFDDPEGYVRWKIEMLESRPPLDDGEDEDIRKAMSGVEGFLRNKLVSDCGQMYEALLGAGRVDAAARVASELITVAPSGWTYSKLIEFAVRAGSLEAARSTAKRGLEELPESEHKRVRRAQGRIPAPK